MSKKVTIEPKVLQWAIDESQIPLFQIEKKYKKIEEWLNGKDSPTFIQAKELSNYLKVPFGYMFLKEPPNNDKIKTEFRTIDNKINSQFSKDLKDVLIDMEFKKDWMSEYIRQQGNEPIKFNIQINENSSPTQVAKDLYRLLNLSTNWFEKVKNPEDSFAFLRRKIEEIGIIVMVSSIVEQNTNRILNINEFRAFALMDQFSPLIFINRNDSHTGMIFSLIHELIHILLDNDDILIYKDTTDQSFLERTINSFVGEFLVPTYYLENHWNKKEDPIKQIDKIAKTLKSSPIAVAIQARNLLLISNNIVNQIYAIMNSNINKVKKKSSGGNYYSTLASRISNKFANAVIYQTEIGAMRYTDAYRLLGINGNVYQHFKEYKNNKILTND